MKPTFKKDLLQHCIDVQLQNVQSLEMTMKEVQESANEESGSMEEKFESFKAQLQQDRDMYARQFVEAKTQLDRLQQMDVRKERSTVSFGAIVETDRLFFIAINLGLVNFEEKKINVISTSSPLYLAMKGKSKGELFEFRGTEIEIKELY